jgi:predicted transcriptional regulator
MMVTITVSVPVEVANRLESIARAECVSVSAVARDLLSVALYGKPGETEARGNRDGQDAAARAVIEANPGASVRDTVKLLSASGIKRGKTWVSDTKMALREAVRCPSP